MFLKVLDLLQTGNYVQESVGFDSHCPPMPQVCAFSEALAEGAVKMGMPCGLAHRIAAQTLLVSVGSPRGACEMGQASMHTGAVGRETSGPRNLG